MATADSARPPADDARDELQAAVPDAAETLCDLLDANDERVRLRAAEAILDRAGITKGKRVAAPSAAKKVGGEPSMFDRSVEDIA